MSSTLIQYVQKRTFLNISQKKQHAWLTGNSENYHVHLSIIYVDCRQHFLWWYIIIGYWRTTILFNTISDIFPFDYSIDHCLVDCFILVLCWYHIHQDIHWRRYQNMTIEVLSISCFRFLMGFSKFSSTTWHTRWYRSQIAFTCLVLSLFSQ
jgi:hypothetical protein